MQGYQALHETAALVRLGTRGRIAAAGEDAARLLHAMSTNHIQQLQPGQGCYAFFLTAQGKIICDAVILCFADHFLIDVEPEAAQRIYEHLDRFIIADDVALEDRSASWTAFSVEGPRAAEVLAAAGIPRPAQPWTHEPWNEGFIVRCSVTGVGGWRISVPKAAEAGALAGLSGAVEADDEAVRVVRLEEGRPRYGEDIFEVTLPMETAQEHGLHYSKGCYIGQEIVERVRSRGHVNRLLAGLRLEGSQPPAAGARILVAGADVGKVTSAVYSPVQGQIVGLAYLRVPHNNPGTAVEVEGLRGATSRVAGPEPIAES